MGRKAFSIIIVVVFMVLALSVISFAADVKAPAADVKKAAPAHHTSKKANFVMISGTILSIDNTDPTNIKVQVKTGADGSIHTVSVTPWTNITKAADLSDIKTGEPIRIMTRKVEDKDVAMGIMLGKIKNVKAPPHAPKAPIAPQVIAPKAPIAPQAPAAKK